MHENSQLSHGYTSLNTVAVCSATRKRLAELPTAQKLLLVNSTARSKPPQRQQLPPSEHVLKAIVDRSGGCPLWWPRLAWEIALTAIMKYWLTLPLVVCKTCDFYSSVKLLSTTLNILYRQTDRDTQTHRQIVRQTDRQTDRQREVRWVRGVLAWRFALTGIM